MQKSFDIDCELNYQVFTPSTFVFKVEAAYSVEQIVTCENLTTVPPLPFNRLTDPLGTRTLRFNVAPGAFSLRYQATASVDRNAMSETLQETEMAALPLNVLPYVTGSRYVESELLFQDAVARIGTHDRGYRRVERICQWVRDNIKYEIGTSLPHGTTRDVLQRRTGVCRDYAHVAIGLCRALNIPARFVVGHIHWDVPPPDFHALFEVWLEGRWILFDPTAMADPCHLIRIGTGFDAADLPFATIFGSAQMTRMNPLVFESRSTH